MANGYLGKISAVVSANTADFQGKLNAAAKDVQKFASSMQGSLSSAQSSAATSLRGIYTDAQKLERALTAISTRKLSFRGFGDKDLDTAVGRMRALYSATEQINKPLADAAKGFGRLPAEIQGAFLPALVSAQKAAESLAGEINKTGSVGSERFEAIASKVDRTTAAMSRLKEAAALVSSLPTGQELNYQRPEMVAESRRSVSLQAEIASLPPQVAGGFGDLIAQQRAAAAETARLAAAAEQAQLSRSANAAAATSAYQNQLALQKEVNDLVAREVASRRLAANEAAREAVEIGVSLNALQQAGAVAGQYAAARRVVAEEAAREAVEIGVSLNALQQAGAIAGQYAAARRVVAEEAAREAVEIGVSLDSLKQAGAIAGQYAAARRVVADEAAREAVQIGVSLEALRKSADVIPRRGDLYDKEREGIKFAVTGGFSNAAQIEAEVSRVTADLQKLDATQKAAFGKRAMLVIDLLGDNKIQDAAIEVKNLRSDLDQQMELKVTTDAAQKAVDDFKTKMSQVRDQNAFVITGRPQNMEQAESRESTLRREIGELKGPQRAKFKGLLEDAAVARETSDLVKYNDVLDKIATKLASAKRFNVTTAQAKKDLDDLKSTMDSLRDESNFVISAKVQNAGQAEAEIKRIVGGMEQLDAAQRQSLQPKVDAAISSLGTKDIAIISAAIKDLDDEFEKEREIKVKADEAKKSVDSLRESLGSIADRIGDPSEPIDRLRKAVDAANAAIAKMPAGAIKTKLEGDLNSEKVRIEAMAGAGSPPPTPPDIDAAAARANAIAAAATAGTPAKATPNPLGADFGTAERRVASLQSTVISLQSSLEKLPTPMQAQFIPAINKVRDAFQKLTPSSTAAEIDAVTKKAAGLERAFARAGQAAKFGGTLGEALNAAAITKTEKQLGFIRSKLLEVGATASGPVAAAFNAYSAAAAAAAKAGISGTAATTKQLDGLIAKIGEALVAEGKLTAAQGKAFSKSVGDVGRAGADKFALALNQAAFAIDDFLSSTGGLEFKLRAISNNVTQLAFILGGTTGLFVGLGAVIAGQAAVGLIKWANNGRSAEDQTKALNDALARQKSLVEELAQAFTSLGDSMSRGTLSAGGEQAAEFSRQMEDIRKKQIESRKERVAGLDAGVQAERGEQNKLQKQLDASTDPGQRIALQAAIDISRERERRAADAALERASAGASPADVLGAVASTIRPSEFLEGGRATRRSREMAESRQAAAQADVEAAGGDVIKLEEVLRKRLEERQAVAQKPLGVMNLEENPEIMRAREDVASLTKIIATLQDPVRAAIDKAANEIAEASRGPAAQIRQAQEDVAEAIRRGVPNAAAFQRELDANAKKLKEAYVSLEEAQKETDPDKKRAKVDEAKANIDQVEAEGADIRLRSREMRLGRTFGGERTTAALASIQGNERFRGDEYSIGTTAYIQDAIDQEIEARRQLEVATAKGSDAEIKAAEAELEAAQRASEAAAAFGEAALAVEESLSRIRKIGDSALQRSEQGADAAQKAFEENPLRAGSGQSRDDAERSLIDDRARVAQAQVGLDIRRGVVQNDPRMRGINKELEAITQRRADLEAKVRTGGLDPAEQKELDSARKREIELMRQREHLARDLTEAERKQLDAINNGIAAREKELEKSRQRAAEDPTFKRRMDATNQLIADSERQANEARERFINNPSAENLRERDEADENLRRDRQRAQELQDDLDNARREMESDPRVAGNNKAIAENDKRLAELAEKEASVGLTQDEKDERRRLQGENRSMRRDNEDMIAAGTEYEQDAVDAQQQGIRDRDRARRGRELGMTPEERFRRDFREGVGADINARAKELSDQGVNPQAFLRQAIQNQMEQVAPMLQQFQEERQNAMLQGPSRAALNVSDVSTSQGQGELNRLLRGDDSAKDVNLAELRKQTDRLDEVVKAIREGNPGVLL